MYIAMRSLAGATVKKGPRRAVLYTVLLLTIINPMIFYYKDLLLKV